MFTPFADLDKENTDVGSKAYMLAMMLQQGYPVPNGAVLSSLPTDQVYEQILKWWESVNHAPLAVRSSAKGEDSGENSFAGQNTTFLNIKSENDLKIAIQKCFESSQKGPSVIYRKFFSQSEDTAKMNVVLQVMVAPIYAGVYFSKDPTKEQIDTDFPPPWLIESVEGLGEDLVSGKKTPKKFSTIDEKTDIPLKEILFWGEKIKHDFNYEVDMEWAYGQIPGEHEKKFFVLQSRPITTKNSRSIEKKIILQEIEKLKGIYPLDTLFDGSTFGEWTGVVTPATFSIWQKVFAPNGAYDLALQKIGYRHFPFNVNLPDNSLLQKIFGRGHLVLSKLADFYFGAIPYTYVRFPRPKLVFDWKKLTPTIVFKTPKIWYRMIKVGLKVSSNRREIIKELKADLEELRSQKNYFDNTINTENLTLDEATEKLFALTGHFSRYTLRSPMLLVTLIESTSQTIKSFLKGVVLDDEIDKTIELWMQNGFETITFKMQHAYRDASINPELQKDFLKEFGHRGIGDLDLSNPRYVEIGEAAFIKGISNKDLLQKNIKNTPSAEDKITALKTYKKELLLKEWSILKELLFLREEFKMHYLKEYFLIRKHLLRIGEITHLKEDIFYLSIDQILNHDFNIQSINQFKDEKKFLKKISLPPLFQLQELEETLLKGVGHGKKYFTAEALSPGMVYGEVRVVLDPENVDTSLWPENVIIVTESTDPGWTGLFIKAKGLIVEKGGILSHAAIVAREMGLPAVGQLYQCHLIFKDGDKIWLDGNNGTITVP